MNLKKWNKIYDKLYAKALFLGITDRYGKQHIKVLTKMWNIQNKIALKTKL